MWLYDFQAFKIKKESSVKFGNTLSFRFKWTHRDHPSCFTFWVWAGLALSVEERKIKAFCAITASTVVSQISRYLCKKKFDPGRTRTCNPLIRSQMPCPLGHRTSYTVFGARENPSLTTLQPKLKQQVLDQQLGTKMHQFEMRAGDGWTYISWNLDWRKNNGRWVVIKTVSFEWGHKRPQGAC